MQHEVPLSVSYSGTDREGGIIDTAFDFDS